MTTSQPEQRKPTAVIPQRPRVPQHPAFGGGKGLKNSTPPQAVPSLASRCTKWLFLRSDKQNMPANSLPRCLSSPWANNPALCARSRAVGRPPSPLAHLEDGVLLLVLGAVPGGVFPGDLEAFGLAVQPDQPGVHPAVHLGHQPRLQAHPARVEGHGLQGGRAEHCWGLPQPRLLQRN